jgi:hypothetical protein
LKRTPYLALVVSASTTTAFLAHLTNKPDTTHIPILCKINERGLETTIEVGSLTFAQNHLFLLSGPKMRNEFVNELVNYLFIRLSPPRVVAIDLISEQDYFGEPGLKHIISTAFQEASKSVPGEPLDFGNAVTGITASLLTLCDLRQVEAAVIVAVVRGLRINEDNYEVLNPLYGFLGVPAISHFQDQLVASTLALYS